LIGLVLVALGQRWGDPIAGVAVTLFVLHVGYQVTGEILHHLMDGVDADVLSVARDAARSVPGVDDAVVLGRWMGRSLIVEIEAELNDDVLLGRADRLGERVEAALYEAVPAARRVYWRPVSRSTIDGQRHPWRPPRTIDMM
jgi:divalent metal cation (Fe/Co/Zn/Cd) transporter